MYATGLTSKKPNPEIEKQVLKLYNQGCSDVKIAGIVGVTSPTISIWRKKRGLPYNKRGILTADEKKTCLKLYKQGKSDGEISRVSGIALHMIYRWRHNAGLSANVGIYSYGVSYKKALPPEQHEDARCFLRAIKALKDNGCKNIDLDMLREVYQRVREM
ncbi:MAG: hypothetical protein H6Q71_1721 [Firmicutes bacterium]|nr:hypothetical protein [Bacillota bacterium]